MINLHAKLRFEIKTQGFQMNDLFKDEEEEPAIEKQTKV